MLDRDLSVLLAVAQYYVLSRPQIQYLCFSTDKTGRVTRRRLQALVSDGLINRFSARVIHPNSAPAGSVYYPSAKGCQFLAENTGDQRYLVTPTQCPQSHHVLHWLAVTDTHIKLDEAISAQDMIALNGWINEWDTVNCDEQNPDNRYRLHTLITSNPRLICAPDSAFMMSVLGYSKVFYLEQDRGTTGATQVCARKIKGYKELAAKSLHRNHFAATNVPSITVVCVANSTRRRDALRRAFTDQDGSDLWKFCSETELNRDSFLHDPIWYPAKGDATPLVKLPEANSATVPTEDADR